MTRVERMAAATFELGAPEFACGLENIRALSKMPGTSIER